MDLPWRFRFAGGVAWFVAACPLVFSSDHPKLALRESGRGADCILHFSDRVVVAGRGAGCFELVLDF